MNNEQKQIPVKIVILGGNLTGKTNFTFHFINHDFIQQYFESKSVQFYTKSINCLNKNLKLDIWDTVGNVRFRHLNKIFYKNANICLILFDLTNLDSLNDVDYYYNEIKIHNYKNCCIILVGNKCDDIENRKIFKKDIKQLKEKYKKELQLEPEEGIWPSSCIDDNTKFKFLNDEKIQKKLNVSKKWSECTGINYPWGESFWSYNSYIKNLKNFTSWFFSVTQDIPVPPLVSL